ncbi:MAG: hypothetical protein K6C36_07250 [Clostridia bacterium]|nr:hypothetical protein [Clostridia bacterium]
MKKLLAVVLTLALVLSVTAASVAVVGAQGEEDAIVFDDEIGGDAAAQADSGEVVAWFSDFDPSTITDMFSGIDLSSITGMFGDFDLSNITDLLSGFDIGSLLDGLDLDLGGFEMPDILSTIMDFFSGLMGGGGSDTPTTAAPDNTTAPTPPATTSPAPSTTSPNVTASPSNVRTGD